ncbi:MAG: TIGR02452 family protein [Candidatus Paracaedibacter sp.]
MDGVTATIEEAVVYAIPELSPVLGILAQAHAYPLPETGGMYIPHANIRCEFRTNRLISKTPVDLIFSVAYDLREKKDFAGTPEYLQGTQEKIATQLKIAAENKVETLFLSAYGCGVFGNEPSFIANTYKALIETHCRGTSIKKVVFAIIDGPEKTRLNFRKEVVENKNSIFFEVFSR